ncbi:AcrR family transcriptional regulator [Pseudarthrobacter oxydans]|uniref:AcrR family transcriptional regulator n=1 Tax=Pseudarthrobacter oxydans TaxID=1671 RepID=A0AAW8NJE2_PSEOX|nr:TetR/AcrR family transcriptional regulator [Pseudarthrobacter oxydans]MDR7166118.1 AcrR family transcriptional regulator [Pseudarthrobacter oxydans]
MSVTGSRERMVLGAADLLSRLGLGATSMRELAKHAGTPLGSTYHYFPGGKRQLAREAVEFAGAQVAGTLGSALKAGPAEGLDAFLSVWRGILEKSSFDAGCPVLSVAVTEPRDGDSGEAVAAASAVFADWCGLLASSLREAGVARNRADELSILIVCAVEGSVALCRASGTAEALDQVGATLSDLIRASLPQEAGK